MPPRPGTFIQDTAPPAPPNTSQAQQLWLPDLNRKTLSPAGSMIGFQRLNMCLQAPMPFQYDELSPRDRKVTLKLGYAPSPQPMDLNDTHGEFMVSQGWVP